jgi:hypothetical protein
VFAIVVAMIGLVFTAGFSGLQDVRDVERVNNAERAFEVLWDNTKDMTDRGAPSRATEIKLSAASISFGEPVQVNVSRDGGTFNTSQTIDPIVYDADTGTRIVYAGGAVLRQQRDGGIVTHSPGFVFSPERTVIPIVETRRAGSGGVGGDGTVLVRMTTARRNVLYASGDGSVTLWVNITTPRAETWHDYLTDREDVTCEPVTGEEVACQVTTRRAYVTRISIDTTIV